MRRGAQEKRRGTYTSPVSDRDGRPGRDLRAGEISGTAALLDTHAILESIPEPVGLVDRQGRILAFNAAGRHVIFAARTQEVALGDDLFSFISPHNVAGVRESLDRAFSGEAHTHKTEAGGRHFETVYSPVRGPGGDVAAVSIRVADVTRRENAIAELAALNATLEQRVAERGEELRVILSATHDGFALFRPGAWFEDVNEAYCRLVGYSRDELLRMNLRDVEAGLSPERFEELSRRLREEGSVSFESRHRRKDGGVVDIDATVNWENVVGGRFFAFVRDISARKEAEAVRDDDRLRLQADLRAALTAVRESDRQVRRFEGEILREAEEVFRQQPAGNFREEGGQDPGQNAGGGELHGETGQQGPATGAEGTQDAMFQAALLQTGLDAGEHDQEPGGQGEEEDILHRQHPAVDDLAYLIEDGIHV